MELTDTAAIVTGGASGLGNATARALAGKGAQVIALDLEHAVDQAEPVDGISYLAADVTKPDEVTAAVAAAVGTGLPLRTVVNCAGIGWANRILSKVGPPHDLDVFRAVIEVNLIGTFNVMRLAAEAIAKTGADEHGQRGVVVNTASVAAFDGQIGQVAYAASKAGVVGLCLPSARDLASFGIRVLTIAPGTIDTPMLALAGDEVRATLASGVPFPKRLGRPEEYARLVLAIADNDYLNGEVIRLDGALRMAPR
ncbi:SDR family NAD(P)-dependent oxidoreductase [Pseudonocardiaceae bacterium YIM PH 21723]|nr:SDR family NAD(P)-dependent oxidoreductase [Pseudonocardiaceae bacterium YIM PH 21723]